jgi:hypothetical protein
VFWASGAEDTFGVGAAVALLLSELAKGLEKGFEKESEKFALIRLESDEHPDSQSSANPVAASRTTVRPSINATKSLIASYPRRRNRTWLHSGGFALREGLR